MVRFHFFLLILRSATVGSLALARGSVALLVIGRFFLRVYARFFLSFRLIAIVSVLIALLLVAFYFSRSNCFDRTLGCTALSLFALGDARAVGVLARTLNFGAGGRVFPA